MYKAHFNSISKFLEAQLGKNVVVMTGNPFVMESYDNVEINEDLLCHLSKTFDYFYTFESETEKVKRATMNAFKIQGIDTPEHMIAAGFKNGNKCPRHNMDYYLIPFSGKFYTFSI